MLSLLVTIFQLYKNSAARKKGGEKNLGNENWWNCTFFIFLCILSEIKSSNFFVLACQTNQICKNTTPTTFSLRRQRRKIEICVWHRSPMWTKWFSIDTYIGLVLCQIWVWFYRLTLQSLYKDVQDILSFALIMNRWICTHLTFVPRYVLEKSPRYMSFLAHADVLEFPGGSQCPISTNPISVCAY